MSVKIRGLTDPGARGALAKRQRAESLGVWVMLLSWVSGERSDGFLTFDVVYDLFGWPAAVERLLRAQYERAPLLHTRETAAGCQCMAGRRWVDGYDFLIHDYLDRNPSRSENDVQRAKARELRNATLKRAVRDRDHDRCRYCGRECLYTDRVSDAGLTFDHVDPEVAGGIDNLVVACRGCNNKKNRRTPREADMVLLDPWRPMDLPTTDLQPSQVADLGTSQVSSQVPSQVSSQIRTSPGRDGAGTVVGPPTPRVPAHNQSPYRRERTPHAGHPPEATS